MMAGLDWINPVLLREYQQVIRSRLFVWVGLLWLLAQLLISLIFISAQEPKEAGLSLTGPGGQYFGFVMGGLATVLLLVLPFSTFNRVLRDRKEATLELLTISRVSSLQIVFGFLLIAFAQTALFLVMSFPFVVFAYLFRGLELGTVLWSLYFLALLALVANSATLTIASFCRTPRVAAAVRIVFAVLLLTTGLPTVVPLLAALVFMRGRGISGGAAPDLPWELVGLLTLGAVLACGLGVVISRSNLLFEAANRTTLPRLCVTVIFLIAGAIVNGFAWWGTHRDDDMVIGFDVLSFLALLAYSLWILGESNQITLRMRESFPQHALLRWLAWPYLPGRGTAFVYVLLTGLLLAGMSWAGYLGTNAGLRDPDLIRGSLLKTYLFLPIGIAVLLHHLLQRTRLRHVYYIAWFLIVLSVFIWLPLLLGFQPFTSGSKFSNFILGEKHSALSYTWRGIVAPLLGCLLALPSIWENARNLRRPPPPAAVPPVIKS